MMGFRNRPGQGSTRKSINSSGGYGGFSNNKNGSKPSDTTCSSDKNTKMEFITYQEDKTNSTKKTSFY